MGGVLRHLWAPGGYGLPGISARMVSVVWLVQRQGALYTYLSLLLMGSVKTTRLVILDGEVDLEDRAFHAGKLRGWGLKGAGPSVPTARSLRPLMKEDVGSTITDVALERMNLLMAVVKYREARLPKNCRVGVSRPPGLSSFETSLPSSEEEAPLTRATSGDGPCESGIGLSRAGRQGHEVRRAGVGLLDQEYDDFGSALLVRPSQSWASTP